MKAVRTLFVLAIALTLAACSGEGAETGAGAGAVQAAPSASAADSCSGGPDQNAYNGAPIGADSRGSQIDVDMRVTTLVGQATALVIAGRDSSGATGGFAPARVERLSQATGDVLTSVKLDAPAVGTSDGIAQDITTAFADVDQIAVGGDRVYVLWSQTADWEAQQSRLVALDGCTLAVMATVEVAAAQLFGDHRISYESQSGNLWVPGLDGTVHVYDGKTLAELQTISTDPLDTVRCVASAAGKVWLSGSQNGSQVYAVDPASFAVTPAVALSTDHQDFTCTQAAGNFAYISMAKQLVEATSDGSAGSTWPFAGSQVSGVANDDTWAVALDGIHGLGTGVFVPREASSQALTAWATTTTASNVWIATTDGTLFAY